MANPTSIDLYLLLFGGTITLLLLSVGLVTFLLQYQKQIIKRDLAFKEAELLHGQKLIQGTLEATEQERERLARDLHDVVGASLSAIRLQLTESIKHVNNKNEVLQISEKNKELVDSTIQEVQRISKGLLPPGLEEFGLAYSLENLCENILSYSELTISLNINKLDNINKQKSLNIYRITQELLNNSIKHADASQVNILVAVKNNELIYTYEDNGKGFNFNEAYKKNSLGLKNIEVRAKMINGIATFTTKPDEGLKVEIKVPH